MQTPGKFGETPTPKRSVRAGGAGGWDAKTPSYLPGVTDQTPVGFGGATPTGMQTPMDYTNLSAEQIQRMRVEKDIDDRNRPFTDQELDQILPGLQDGYEILKPPESYIPYMNPATRLL